MLECVGVYGGVRVCGGSESVWECMGVCECESVRV